MRRAPEPASRLRPALPADHELLYRIYASTRLDELAVTGWSEAEKADFLRSQFDLQHRFYHEHYADAEYQIIEVEGAPAGRLYLWRGVDDLNIIDIALLPELRGKGIGSELIRSIQDEAESAHKTVSIYVEKFNRALGLYRRLGFAEVEDEGVYLRMVWPGDRARPELGSPKGEGVP